MKKIAVSVALSSALFSTAAFAQGATVNGPTGIRIEARAGADIARISAEGEGESSTGFDYSIEAGYDFNAGGAIVGAYAGIGDSSTEECAEAFGGDELCLRSGRDITVGGRLGYSISDNSLVFVKGGYSNGRLRLTYADPAFPADNFEASDNIDGYHLGAGVEFGIGRNAYVKAEYNYTNYSTNTDEDFGISSDLERHRILGGVGMRF